MEVILPISLKLNFSPNTLGCYGLNEAVRGHGRFLSDVLKWGCRVKFADSAQRCLSAFKWGSQVWFCVGFSWACTFRGRPCPLIWAAHWRWIMRLGCSTASDPWRTENASATARRAAPAPTLRTPWPRRPACAAPAPRGWPGAPRASEGAPTPPRPPRPSPTGSSRLSKARSVAPT